MVVFAYSREMPGQVPQRSRPPPYTSLTFDQQRTFLLFDALQAELLAVSFREPQINTFTVRYANIGAFAFFFHFSVREGVENWPRSRSWPCVISFSAPYSREERFYCIKSSRADSRVCVV
jgi:hypothetical protein